MGLFEQIQAAFANMQPGSKLAEVHARWANFEHVVQVNGRWRAEGFITCFQHLHEILRAIDPSVQPSLPRGFLDLDNIARIFKIPPSELNPNPDGPFPPNEFWWKGKPYRLDKKEWLFLTVMWFSPGHSLELDTLAKAVWNIRPAALTDAVLGRARSYASRLNHKLFGTGLHIKVLRDRLTEQVRVELLTQ